VIGVAVMSLVAGLAIPLEGARGLAIQIALAGSSYGIALILMNAMGLRSRLIEAYTRFIANRPSTP
jgi:hypothetical protein